MQKWIANPRECVCLIIEIYVLLLLYNNKKSICQAVNFNSMPLIKDPMVIKNSLCLAQRLPASSLTNNHSAFSIYVLFITSPIECLFLVIY